MNQEGPHTKKIKKVCGFLPNIHLRTKLNINRKLCKKKKQEEKKHEVPRTIHSELLSKHVTWQPRTMCLLHWGVL